MGIVLVVKCLEFWGIKSFVLDRMDEVHGEIVLIGVFVMCHKNRLVCQPSPAVLLKIIIAGISCISRGMHVGTNFIKNQRHIGLQVRLIVYVKEGCSGIAG